MDILELAARILPVRSGGVGFGFQLFLGALCFTTAGALVYWAIFNHGHSFFATSILLGHPRANVGLRLIATWVK